jgi:hypothetical protein
MNYCHVLIIHYKSLPIPELRSFPKLSNLADENTWFLLQGRQRTQIRIDGKSAGTPKKSTARVFQNCHQPGIILIYG